MQKNVGGTERTVRIAVGIVLLVAMMATVAFGQGFGDPVQGLVAGILLLASGIVFATVGSNTCPVNSLLGRNTYEPNASQD